MDFASESRFKAAASVSVSAATGAGAGAVMVAWELEVTALAFVSEFEQSEESDEEDEEELEEELIWRCLRLSLFLFPLFPLKCRPRRELLRSASPDP